MLFFLKDINYIWGNRSVIFVFHAGFINFNFSGEGVRGRIPSTSAHKAYTDSTFSRVNGALYMNEIVDCYRYKMATSCVFSTAVSLRK